MKKVIGIILLVAALFIGYTGINTVSNSGESVDVLGLELSVSDEDQKTTGFLYLGFAALSLIGGITLIKKS